MTLNQITAVTLEKISTNKEVKVTKIDVIPDDIIDLEKGYYDGVYVMIHIKKENFIDRKE